LPLRKADVTQTRRFEDGDDWLVIRTELTKGESDLVKDLSSALRPASEDGLIVAVEVQQHVAEANRKLFDILAEDWSLGGECTGQAYSALDEESGRWIDECIGEVLQARRERAEKNVGTSSKSRKRAGSSARVAASK
jgi:hypothetical protein